MQFKPTYLWHFSDSILVRCPRCAACAYLRRLPRDEGDSVHFRLVCPDCAHANDWLHQRNAWVPGPNPGPELPDFDLVLWLQWPCCGEILWAYNAEHISFLERFIGADLRERRFDASCSNQSLASRLPRWVLSGKKRDEVMRSLAALRRLVTTA